MAKAQRPSLFTIPNHRAFADCLAQGVGMMIGDSPLVLAQAMILLPNQRARQAVLNAFVRLRGAGTLLPRLVVLGDDDIDAAGGGSIDRLGTADDMPPTIAPLHRLFLLSGLITRHKPDASTHERLRLAQQLAQAMDQLHYERIAFDRFSAQSDASGLSEHWQESYAMFEALLIEWPALLETMGLIDRADHRNRQYTALADLWTKSGLPARHVFAAGISTTAPAVADLLRAIVHQPGGYVVLPHCDLGMPDAHWDAIGSAKQGGGLQTHPQYAIKKLLDAMGYARGEVALWPGKSDFDGPSSRIFAARQMMLPAQFSAEWHADTKSSKATLPNVTAHVFKTPADEAQGIALMMRHALEMPGQTAALVTPDRGIARRVAEHLRRWDIVVDDSAGQPLTTTAAGDVIMSLAAVIGSNAAPVDLLAMLSNPMVRGPIAAGDDETSREVEAEVAARLTWLDQVRALDLALRGPRPAAGLPALRHALARAIERDASFANFWEDVETQLSPLISDGVARPMAHWLSAMLAVLRNWADDRLWTGQNGRAMSALFEDVIAQGDMTPTVKPHELAAVCKILLDSLVVHPPQGGHPRLYIWGLLEARLQRVDRMILAGLNEGQWPQLPSVDPWLAPAIRKQLNIDSVDRQIGLSAHDFTTALGAPAVALVRSERQGNAPTVASRFWLRIEALLGEKRALGCGPIDFAALSQTIDAPTAVVPLDRPYFAPPTDARPTRLGVTDVDVLRSDPFAFYARVALGLAALDRVDADPGPAWRGTRVHRALEQWLKQPVQTREQAERIWDDLLADPGVNPTVRTLWGPRVRLAIGWAADTIIAGKMDGRHPIESATERKGTATINGITISGVPDRIDRMPDGTLAIVDYKTGDGPPKAQEAAGYALQLGLLGWMAEQGVFTQKRAERVSVYEYWRLKKQRYSAGFGWTDPPFKSSAKASDDDAAVTADNFAAFAHQQLFDATDRWLHGDAAFVSRIAPKYVVGNGYDHLARLEE
ncbi:MAG: double-strand break repair protein AddB, partial [Sphingopyxis sp.]|nr:double-strand break repair protein AddB [Sphingopyxis sp.]